MISIFDVFFILIIHWVADFILQTDEMAKGKSKQLSKLLSHTLMYSLFWTSAIFLYECFYTKSIQQYIMIPHNVFDFASITFFAHTITDYFTSRFNAKLWEQGKTHNFFVAVGFDQILHYIQLILTFYFIIK